MSDTPKPLVGRESDKFMLRFPEGMRDHIADAATRNRRSMNAEVIARLERTFRWDEVEHPHPQELSAEIQAAAKHLQELMHEFRMLQVNTDTPAPRGIVDDDDIELPAPIPPRVRSTKRAK